MPAAVPPRRLSALPARSKHGEDVSLRSDSAGQAAGAGLPRTQKLRGSRPLLWEDVQQTPGLRLQRCVAIFLAVRLCSLERSELLEGVSFQTRSIFVRRCATRAAAAPAP